MTPELKKLAEILGYGVSFITSQLVHTDGEVRTRWILGYYENEQWASHEFQSEKEALDWIRLCIASKQAA